MSDETGHFARCAEIASGLRNEVAKVVVGRDEIVEQLLIATLAGGHCLLEGPPGVARSLLAASFARALGLDFDRVRCTGALSPEQLLGDGDGSGVNRGPLAANVVVIDDYPRLSEATDSVIRQAVNEGEVTMELRRFPLPQPQLIVATRYVESDEDIGPVELRDDRFMFHLAIGYPAYHDEYEMADSASAPDSKPTSPVSSAAELLELREVVRHAELPPHVIHYALRLARATRIHEAETPDFVYEWISVGAGPRAVHYLTLAAKIRAALHGRSAATTDDVQAIAPPTLRHRILRNQNARENGITIDKVISRLLYEIPDREEGDDRAPTKDDQMAW